MGTTCVFSSGYGRVLTSAVAVLAVLVTISVLDQPVRTITLTVLLAALSLVVVWALFWRPAVEVSDGEVVIRNVLRTIHVPWPAYVSHDVRWSLVVTSNGGAWTAWSAPRSSGSASALRRGPHGLAEVEAGPAAMARATSRRPAGSSAEVVAHAIDERHRALVRAGHLTGAARTAEDNDIRPTVTWHRTTVVAAAVLALAAVAVAVAG
ncbi:MAG: PH domain-containing protein [Cellulomonadaceae bacterium]|nr:PH domain-containing protein [Cellulomonadaceae bacterium]